MTLLLRIKIPYKNTVILTYYFNFGRHFVLYIFLKILAKNLKSINDYYDRRKK